LKIYQTALSVFHSRF